MLRNIFLAIVWINQKHMLFILIINVYKSRDARFVHYCPRKKLALQSLIKNGMLSYQIVKIEQCGFLFDSARRICALTPFDQTREMRPIGQRDTHYIGELIK